MVIKQTWYKGADHKSCSLEGLVNGRWLVDSACDRFKVMNGQGVRVKVAVPTHDVQGTVRIVVGMQHALLFDLNQVISLLFFEVNLVWRTDISLAVGGML